MLYLHCIFSNTYTISKLKSFQQWKVCQIDNKLSKIFIFIKLMLHFKRTIFNQLSKRFLVKIVCVCCCKCKHVNTFCKLFSGYKYCIHALAAFRASTRGCGVSIPKSYSTRFMPHSLTLYSRRYITIFKLEFWLIYNGLILYNLFRRNSLLFLCDSLFLRREVF